MSDYLSTRSSFSSAINRGQLRFRSKSLDAMVKAIEQFIANKNPQNFAAVRVCWEKWETDDPKEFNNRGRPIKVGMDAEIAQASRLYELDRGAASQKAIWIPGPPDVEMDGRAASIIQVHQNIAPQPLHGGERELVGFPTENKLYVLAHGDSHVPLFGTRTGGTWTASQIVEMLAGDGLSEAHRDIELLVCTAGESVNMRGIGNLMIDQRRRAQEARANGDAPGLARLQKAYLTVRRRSPKPQFFEQDPENWLLPLAAEFAMALKRRRFTHFRVISYRCPIAQYNPDGHVYLDLSSKGGSFGVDADDPANFKYRAVWQ